MSRVRKRPAEYGGGLAAVVVAVAYAAGLSADTIAALGVAAGLVPAVVTYVVDHGGIKGTLALLWSGRR